MSESDSQVAAGDVIAGKYRVERILGKGGMGVVLAAIHLELGEPRAIKLLLPEVLASEDLVRRFLREAKLISRLKSRHVVQVFDVGRLDDGAPFIVMEYLEGEDVESLLQRQADLDTGTVVDILLQAMEAIAEAHSVGIVHRDLKPANLFLAQDLDGPCVKVLDFGISKLSEPGTNMSMTATDAVMGTPFYMSPEQMMSAKEVDHRTDIWSLGVVAYELLCKELPFRGASVGEQCKLLLTTSAPPVSSRRPVPLPDGLDRVIMHFLAKEANDRYPDVAAAARALRPYATDPDADRLLRRIEGALGRGPRRSLASLSSAEQSGRFSVADPTTREAVTRDASQRDTGPTGTITQNPDPQRDTGPGSFAATAVASDSDALSQGTGMPVVAETTLDSPGAPAAAGSSGDPLSKSTKATWQTVADRGAARSPLPKVLAALAIAAVLTGVFLVVRGGGGTDAASPGASTPASDAEPATIETGASADHDEADGAEGIGDSDTAPEPGDGGGDPAATASATSTTTPPAPHAPPPAPLVSPPPKPVVTPKPVAKPKPLAKPKPVAPPPAPVDPFGTGRH